MYVLAAFRGCHPVQLELSFEDFLYSGLMRRQAQVAMCTPDDLITDHLPGFDCGDSTEVREAFAEACEQASDYVVSKVTLDDEDEQFVRQCFLGPDRLRLVDPDLLPAA